MRENKQNQEIKILEVPELAGLIGRNAKNRLERRFELTGKLSEVLGSV